MNSATSEPSYARAQQIVHEVFDLPLGERAERIASLCGGNTSLAAEVQWLIKAVDDDALDIVPESVGAVAQDIASEWHLAATIPGNYRLIKAIGEGGMGVVWLAEREVGGARQRVALKRLHTGAVSHRSRLIEEQRILATLAHPNIARLLDAGEDRHGAPFLAMEFVDGERIDHWCFARNLDLRARIALFIKACAAVSYAHQQLVIHRDLKPSNILVDASGEPKLLDFGIARLIAAEAAQHTATRLMTPAYASPEQLEGRPLGTGTDVWSLGVMLYELLCGVRPLQLFDSDHAQALKVLCGGPAAADVSQQAPSPADNAAAAHALGIPADVDAIVRKALRREPELRYASVRELAEDLERFLAARPVLARRGEWSYRASRFVYRNQWPLVAGMAALMAAAGFFWRTAMAEREARMQAQVADRTTEFLISAFTMSDPTQAGNYDYSAREVLDRGRKRIDQELADQPRVRARLLEAMGNAYRGINEGSAGTPLLEEAARLYLQPKINQPLAAARSLRAKAAAILNSRGSTEAALDAAQRAFDLVEKHAPDDLLLLADAYGALAPALNADAKEERALATALEALRLRELGKADVLALARSHVELCTVLSSIGKSIEALPNCQRAQAMYASAGETRSNAYRLALRDLESVLAYLGRHEQAIALARERIALTAELFGEDSAMLASERVWMAVRFGEQGLLAEASDLLALGMPVILMRNGKTSSQYARALFCQGWLHYLQGQFDLAVPPMRLAVAIQTEKVAGRDLGTLHVLRTTLAQVLIESGQANAQARELLESVIAERSQAGSTPNALAYARLPLAQWHAAHGEAAAARALLDQVSAVGAGVEQELHGRVAATRAAIFTGEKEFARAAIEAKSGYEITLADRGDDHPRTIRYALAYAHAARAAGQSTVAEALERKYQPKLALVFPPDSAYLERAAAAPQP